MAGLAVVLVLLGATARFYWAERDLERDWRRLAAAARSSGWRISGEPGARSGWPFAARLVIDDASGDASRTIGLSFAADRLELSRAAGGGDRLVLRLVSPVTISAANRTMRVWGDSVRATFDGDGVVTLAAFGLHAGAGGPDDVMFARSADARAQTAGHASLSLKIDGLTLPLPRATRRQRMLDALRLEATFARHADLRATEFAVETRRDGLRAHLAGSLDAGPAGPLFGRMTLSVGPGWRGAITDAQAAHVVTAPEARAATGLLALIATGDTIHDMPMAVQDGRVTLGGLTLLWLPALPPLAAGRP